MKYALVQRGGSPSVIQVFAALPAELRLPNGDVVYGGTAGFSVGDFALVTVQDFVVPAGQVTTGAPSYALAADANSVVETFATQAAPVSTFVDEDTFLARVQDAEWQAVMAASAANVQLGRWIEKLRGNHGVDVASADAQAAKGALVQAGLLTQDRADAIFAVP